MKLYDPDDAARGPAAALRWGAAAVLVAGLHLAAGWWIVSHPFLPKLPDEAKGIPIDLEPVAVSQNAPEPNASAAAGPAPAPQAAAAPDPAPSEPVETPAEAPDREPPPPEPQQPKETAATPEPTPPAEPAPPAEPPPSAEPPPAPEPSQPPPEPPVIPPPPEKAAASDAVLSPPPPPRAEHARKPDPRVLARETAKRKALAEKRERERAARREARAKAGAEARAARLREGGGAAAGASAAPSSASSGADVASWRGAVVAHLNSFKPASGAGSGTARVAFAVDGRGRVISVSLAGSSGDPTLDAQAIAMVRRASPVPAPPPGLGGRINLVVPVRFF